MPQLSVIVLVYKTQQYLPQCLDSILSQDVADMEVILVDDGSPDNSGKICDDYAAKYSNVRVIHQENSGQNKARIAGARASTGTYITYVDSDDWIMPNMYGPVLAQAHTHNADMLVLGFTQDYGSHQEPYTNRIPSGIYKADDLPWLWDHAIFDLNTMTQAVAPCVWAKLIRREILLDAMNSSPGDICFGEDTLLTFFSMFQCKCVVVMNEHRNYRYQLREGSITNSYYKNYFRDIYTVYDKLTEATEPIKTTELSASIAYNHIFLFWGGLSRELSSANPAKGKVRRQNLLAILQDERLKKCLPLVDISRYPKRTAIQLHLIVAGRYNSFLCFRALCRLWDKTRKLLKKVSG